MCLYRSFHFLLDIDDVAVAAKPRRPPSRNLDDVAVPLLEFTPYVATVVLEKDDAVSILEHLTLGEHHVLMTISVRLIIQLVDMDGHLFRRCMESEDVDDDHENDGSANHEASDHRSVIGECGGHRYSTPRSIVDAHCGRITISF